MIRGAVFDLDHTLFDRYATMRAVIPSFCLNFQMNENMSIDEITEVLIDGDLKFNHRGWDKILEYAISKGIFVNPPTLKEYTDAMLTEFQKCAIEYPFTKPMLNKLHEMGLKTGLITNGKSETQRAKLKILGLEEYLDEIIISGEIGINKPDPAPYLIMADRLCLKPEELIYAGDNPATDISGARAGGYIPVYVETFGRWTIPEIEKTQYSVKDVSEIPDLINMINNSLE